MDFDLENLPPEIWQVVWIVFAARILIWAFYANTVYRTFKAIDGANRFIPPSRAWLLVIPFFNIYWNFVITRNLSNSLNNEFFDRKIAEEENPGLTTGMMYAWMFMLSHIPFPPVFILSFLMLGVVYFIQYWVKVNHFRMLLTEHDRFRARQNRAGQDPGREDQNQSQP